MWHDDEGDEAEGSGELPDPSTRHWRHPSELAKQGALPNQNPVPVPIDAVSATSAAVWPLVAVGGCLAIVALGVVSFRSGLSEPDSLQAGSAVTTAPAPTTSRSLGASAAAEAVATTTTVATSSSSTTGELGASEEAQAIAEGAADWLATANPTTSLASPGSTLDPSTPALGEGAGTSANELLEAAPLAAVGRAPVYGVYPARGRDDGQLGSFVMIGDNPVTSAASLGGRTTIWLRVGSSWVRAVVLAEDPMTDIALLRIVEEADEVELPALVVADDPVDIGSPVMVGYGDPTAITIDEPEPKPEPEPETRLGQDWPEVTEADDPSDTEVRQGPRSTEAQDSIDEETKAWIAGSDRRGVIYSLTKPLATTAGRLIHEPIRLTAEPGPTDAGAPVRNQDGEIVGLVAHSSLPQVAAVPIDRVTEVVGWLQEIGVGDPSWLGLTVMSQPSGVVVTTVDSTGPSTALIPGDIIVAVDGQAVQHPDGLWFAARQVGPGGVLEVTVRGQNQRQSTVVEIVVGTVPAP